MLIPGASRAGSITDSARATGLTLAYEEIAAISHGVMTGVDWRSPTDT